MSAVLLEAQPPWRRQPASSQWPERPLLLMSLALVVHEGLLSQRSVADAVAVGRRIVGHFKHSDLAYSRLEDIQLQINQPTKRLQQDVQTCWNSTFYMIQSLIEQKRALGIYASEYSCLASGLCWRRLRLFWKCVFLEHQHCCKCQGDADETDCRRGQSDEIANEQASVALTPAAVGVTAQLETYLGEAPVAQLGEVCSYSTENTRAQKLLGEKRSGHLTCPEEDINRYLSNTYSVRDQDLSHCAALICPPEPSILFDTNEPTLKEVREVIKSARTASAPGPSGVPYKVFKNCPRLVERIWKIYRVIWKKGKVPQQWRYAAGVWIPKEENASNIEQFRTISLLSVECKTFLKIVVNCLTGFLLKNTYIDTSVQKGEVPGIPGCIKHTGVVTQLIREAQESKGDLAVLWLDLANAYGSIPHKLVELALSRYHVPEKMRNLILDYYNNFSLRVSSRTSTFEWHCLEKGIITGCTISVSLFALAMNMLVKSAEVKCRGPLSRSGNRQPPIRAFMDDLTVTTTSLPGCR
ncbi:Retrovirus-related Pol polyprotein from type-1 retrotransposable element R2 [Merluccius polli]|uniref:Retrovirus-related Pol polyprotein from type-1 retrotransposable element R2 n=1 Tax=Merluccius polli TaxID=89951 RepID=A0AA47MLW7_MERPO|nr:Retrovirus-related Pol polyprotein from type-1 retrotransposable element R2 [Merluccius polli]